jgi:hypothetical protein
MASNTLVAIPPMCFLFNSVSILFIFSQDNTKSTYSDSATAVSELGDSIRWSFLLNINIASNASNEKGEKKQSRANTFEY